MENNKSVWIQSIKLQVDNSRWAPPSTLQPPPSPESLSSRLHIFTWSPSCFPRLSLLIHAAICPAFSEGPFRCLTRVKVIEGPRWPDLGGRPGEVTPPNSRSHLITAIVKRVGTTGVFYDSWEECDRKAWRRPRASLSPLSTINPQKSNRRGQWRLSRSHWSAHLDD